MTAPPVRWNPGFDVEKTRGMVAGSVGDCNIRGLHALPPPRGGSDPSGPLSPAGVSTYDTVMRLGLFGGSFDPVHFGHLILAEFCRETARLDQIWFIPAAKPPHKKGRLLSPDADRLAMLNLATAGHDVFVVSPLELDRGGVSYTVQTLQTIHEQHP